MKKIHKKVERDLQERIRELQDDNEQLQKKVSSKYYTVNITCLIYTSIQS